MTASVDVVILTWNDGPLLASAVSSALASTGVDLRVIVFDNGSSPGAEVAGDGRLSLVRNAVNLGVAAGRNRGAAEGSSPFVCFLDSDARLLPDTLSRLLEPFATSPDVALTAPVFTDQVPEASAGFAPTLGDKAMRVLNLREAYRPVPRNGPWWDVDFAIGACQVVRRVDFEGAGGFDASYFYGPEDVDLCLRLREKGLRIVQVAEADCFHPARRRFRGLWTRRGLQHGWAVARHLWRHRHFVGRQVAA
jgi:GT2 family glycosyltransferase